MNIDKVNMVYFIGAGGIGMSALARYFNITGREVAGYDLTSTALTRKLAGEGIEISFSDDEKTIPDTFLKNNEKDKILVVYTPAVPDKNRILNYFKNNGYGVVKRSKLLGILVNDKRSIAVAGTHGKTSVCTLTSHLLMQTGSGCNAFLGGLSVNYNSNMLVNEDSDLFVVEADEYDRSFLQLRPDMAIITSMDPDHLDIYGTYDEMVRGYNEFAGLVKDGGIIFYKQGLDPGGFAGAGIRLASYGIDRRADYSAGNIRISSDGHPVFDVVAAGLKLSDLRSGVLGRFNVENALAAIAVALQYGISPEHIRSGLESFRGIKRRFEVLINDPDCVLIDDYAHHPAELKACISAVREIFPGREITGVFQPHLYTRTRDFADQFAESLDLLDKLVLLDIYPAREEPVPGVSSELILNKVKLENKILCSREQLTGVLEELETDVVITMGAGNIDAQVEPVKMVLLNKKQAGYEKT